jgi:hypothetical protein
MQGGVNTAVDDRIVVSAEKGSPVSFVASPQQRAEIRSDSQFGDEARSVASTPLTGTPVRGKYVYMV